MEPKVSVCIPAYNNEDTIEETLRCVLEQSYKNIELIVCDDNSKDRTYQVIQNFAKSSRDERLKIFHNESNLGMAGNWNYCLSLCSGTYMRLLCGDDLIDKDLIRREVEILESHPEVVMVSTDTRFIGLDGDLGGQYRRYPKNGVVEGKKAVRFSFFTRDLTFSITLSLYRSISFKEIGKVTKSKIIAAFLPGNFLKSLPRRWTYSL